jgi:hypothetical protein
MALPRPQKIISPGHAFKYDFYDKIGQKRTLRISDFPAQYP